MSHDQANRSGPPFVRVTLPERPSAVRVVDGTRQEFLQRRTTRLLEREFARGRADGERAALTKAAGALTRASEALETSARESAASVARDATRLGVEIARVLLRHEIDAGRYDIERIVRETLQASGIGRGACVLHLHPSDVARLQGVVFRTGTALEADPEVPPGDVHVTTQRGLLVRDVEQAVASIAERLEGDAA